MEYRAAVIGCGRVAWMMEDDPLEVRPCTHMGGWLAYGEKTGKVKVIGASDSDHARLRAFGRRFNITSLYADYKKMLEEVRPDIVSICAYAPERYEMVMDAMERGVKGIWCEKAFGTSLEEAALMRNACEKNGVHLIVSHSRRWHPAYKKAEEIINSGGIGAIQSIVSHFSGSLLHTGTHAFDVLRRYLGHPLWVEGELELKQGSQIWDLAEDLGGRAFIQFKNGTYASVHAGSKGYFLFEFDIIGSQGRIRIGNNEVLEYYTPKTSTHYTGLKELYRDPFPAFEDKNTWVEAAKNLVELLDGTGVNMSPPEEGYGALELALAVHESARQDGKRVEFPLKSKLRVRSR